MDDPTARIELRERHAGTPDLLGLRPPNPLKQAALTLLAGAVAVTVGGIVVGMRRRAGR